MQFFLEGPTTAPLISAFPQLTPVLVVTLLKHVINIQELTIHLDYSTNINKLLFDYYKSNRNIIE